jgi:hypothetical protein
LIVWDDILVARQLYFDIHMQKPEFQQEISRNKNLRDVKALLNV